MTGCGETRDAVASLYPTAEEARITCAIVDAAATVRDLNFKYLAEGKGATITARFGPDGITIGSTAQQVPHGYAHGQPRRPR